MLGMLVGILVGLNGLLLDYQLDILLVPMLEYLYVTVGNTLGILLGSKLGIPDGTLDGINVGCIEILKLEYELIVGTRKSRQTSFQTIDHSHICHPSHFQDTMGVPPKIVRHLSGAVLSSNGCCVGFNVGLFVGCNVEIIVGLLDDSSVEFALGDKLGFALARRY